MSHCWKLCFLVGKLHGQHSAFLILRFSKTTKQQANYYKYFLLCLTTRNSEKREREREKEREIQYAGDI